ncbi:MAG: hypothetical protein ACLR6J_10140 [Parabacteroides merdae]
MFDQLLTLQYCLALFHRHLHSAVFCGGDPGRDDICSVPLAIGMNDTDPYFARSGAYLWRKSTVSEPKPYFSLEHDYYGRDEFPSFMQGGRIRR